MNHTPSLATRRAPLDAEPIGSLLGDALARLRPAPAVSAGAGTTCVARVRSKKELAALYGYGKDTFRRVVKQAGLCFGRRKLLRAAEVEAVVRALGPPSYEFTV